MKRIFDIIFSVLIFACLLVFFILISMSVLSTSKGPLLHWSKRIGQNNRPFLMPKFRTMFVETPDVATHLLKDPKKWITPIGGILRKTSLDELPQLWSIFIGDMSVVGPRPALFNQADLIDLRTKLQVHLLKPGLTGWAQINGRDEISIKEKAYLDREYMLEQSFLLDLKIIFKTFLRLLGDRNVSH